MNGCEFFIQFGDGFARAKRPRLSDIFYYYGQGISGGIGMCQGVCEYHGDDVPPARKSLSYSLGMTELGQAPRQHIIACIAADSEARSNCRSTIA